MKTKKSPGVSQAWPKFLLASLVLGASAACSQIATAPISAPQPAPTSAPQVQQLGPTSGYAAKIAAAVRPNVRYPDADKFNGSPFAEFEAHLAPDGTITSLVLVAPSGTPEWDSAAFKGLQKTQRLPPDSDGRVFPIVIIGLRPKR